MAFEGLVHPELVVRDLADIAVTNFTTNPQVVEWVMQNRPQDERDSILTAVQKRPVKVRHGLGLDQEEDAQVTVMLASEVIRPQTIGNIIGGVEEVELLSTTLTASIAGDYLGALPLPAGAMLSFLPPGGGRVRLDTELATYSLDPAQTVATLVRRGVQQTAAAFHPIGTPVFFHVGEQLIGWDDIVEVRCDVLSTNAGLNMALATCIRSALLISRAAFEDRGLTLETITESEITPRPNQWPAYFLNRTLMVRVQRQFALPERLPFLTDVQVEVLDP
jgi:hypothetical protein